MPSPRLGRFFLWNDIHFRDHSVARNWEGFPNSNEKALWALACIRGENEIEPPDFVVAAGDLIEGDIPSLNPDFDFFKQHILDKLEVPFFPCLGNHDNNTGEGSEKHYAGYDRCFGPGRRNYVFHRCGIAFVVVDSSGGHRTPDGVTAARTAFVRTALAQLEGAPSVIVTHIPLISMRDAAALDASFGHVCRLNQDPGFLEAVEEHADSVIAVLTGHLHITGVQRRAGIHHVVSAGTTGYPSDIASFDIYADRIDVTFHRAPNEILGDRVRGDFHGRHRHGIDYTDSSHPDHENYISGNPDERRFSIALEGNKRLSLPHPVRPEIYTARVSSR